MAVVRAAIVMMGRLQGEESLEAARVVGVGTGSLESTARAAAVRAWERAKRGGESRRRVARKDLRGMAAQLGIKVVEVTRHG